MSSLPIRARLTLAFALVMATVLAATGIFVYLRFHAELDSTLEQGLRSRADEAAALFTGGPSRLSDAQIDRLADQDESFTRVIGPRGSVIIGTRSRGGGCCLPHSSPRRGAGRCSSTAIRRAASRATCACWQGRRASRRVASS